MLHPSNLFLDKIKRRKVTSIAPNMNGRKAFCQRMSTRADGLCVLSIISYEWRKKGPSSKCCSASFLSYAFRSCMSMKPYTFFLLLFFLIGHPV